MNTSFCPTRNNLAAHWYRISGLHKRKLASTAVLNEALGALNYHQETCPICIAHLRAMQTVGLVHPHEQEVA